MTAPESPLPERIGPYKIEGLLERGGMSYLYLGLHPETQESLVVKVLSPKYLSNTEVVARFLNEAKVISLTDHPNIVKLYSYGSWEKGLYIAMEFIRGTSLRTLLTRQPFSLKRALDVVLQTAYALCHLHTHGVIHGDLKPENILITDAGGVKVIDFGIAHLLTERVPAEEVAGRLIGTPIYMSPEQHENPQLMSFQSDIYSLGITAYELLLGKITHGRIILSLAPRGLQPILSRALQPKPEDRYQDVVDFITDLSTYMNSTTLEGDREGTDYFFELFERLEAVQTVLSPKQPATWEGFEIGLASHATVGLHGGVCDWLEPTPTTRAILLAEAGTAGSDGVLVAAMVRTMARALGPDVSMAMLATRAEGDLFGNKLTAILLTIDREKHTMSCGSTGYGLLLHNGKPLTGECHYKSGDRYVLVGHPLNAKAIACIEELYRETHDLPPQKQADLLFRKLRMKRVCDLEDHPLTLAILQVA